MSRRLAELRIYVRDGHQYAHVGWMDYNTKGDIYCGPNAVVNGELDTDSHRFSYHSSGVSISRVRGAENRGLKRVQPFEIVGFESLTTNSGPLEEEMFSRRLPKQQTAIRKNLVVEREQLRGGIVTFESWVMENGRTELLQESFQKLESVGCEIVGVIQANWCVPNTGMTLYTISEKAYESFQQASGGVGLVGFLVSDGQRDSPNAADRRFRGSS